MARKFVPKQRAYALKIRRKAAHCFRHRGPMFCSRHFPIGHSAGNANETLYIRHLRVYLAKVSETPGGTPMPGGATDYLAAERTVLAWIRTGIALMGLGFVLARFGLFLQEFNRLEPDFPARSYGISLWIGVVLILMGVSVCLLSMFRHLRMLKQLEAGESLYLRSPWMLIGVAVALVILVLVIAGYLVFADPK